MDFLVSLIIQGALSGTIYAVIALAFVVVFKASRVANFALGEWVMLGGLLVGIGCDALKLPFALSFVLACLAMIGLAAAFHYFALRHLVGRPLIAIIMITLGLGALLRGSVSLTLSDVPRAVPALLPSGAMPVLGFHVPEDRLVAAAIALATVLAANLFYSRSRTGLALRAVAADQPAAMSCGINVMAYIALAWGLTGCLCVLAGVLWVMTAGGGFGLSLLGLKVFPVLVIGGLDSFGGAVLAAIIVGLVESIASGYGDPVLGSGFGSLATLTCLFMVLYVRPFGMFGTAPVERI